MTARWPLLGLVLLACCASIDPGRGLREAAPLIAERTGAATSWDTGTPEDAQVAAHVGTLLEAGLTPERAVEIALVNNRSLQATYEELGISQAEVVEAGLLRNPTVAGSVGFPGRGGGVEWEWSAALDFLDVLVLPLRRRVAEQQFEADVLRVAHEALQTAADAAKEVREVQARVRLVELRRTLIAAAEAAALLAARQPEAGNITDLELASQRATYEQVRLELANEELLLVEARERLNRLLGLWGPQTQWSLAEALPELPAAEPPLEHLESLALRQRLDVDAARKRTLLYANAAEVARSYRFFGSVEVGVHQHQDTDGPRLFGPTLSLELPLFNQRQGVIARLEAVRRQSERRLQAVSVDARSEVRVARTQLLARRGVVEHLEKVVLPLRAMVLEQAQLQYNAMQIGLYQLLSAKREQVETERLLVEALRDYWTARAELERSVGGRLGAGQGAQPQLEGAHEHHAQ